MGAVLEWKQSQVWALGNVEIKLSELHSGLVNQVCVCLLLSTITVKPLLSFS